MYLKVINGNWFDATKYLPPGNGVLYGDGDSLEESGLCLVIGSFATEELCFGIGSYVRDHHTGESNWSGELDGWDLTRCKVIVWQPLPNIFSVIDLEEYTTETKERLIGTGYHIQKKGVRIVMNDYIIADEAMSTLVEFAEKGKDFCMAYAEILTKAKHILDTDHFARLTRWIPVTDRLPEKPGMYLVTSRYNDCPYEVSVLEYGTPIAPHAAMREYYSFKDKEGNEWAFGEMWSDGMDNIEEVIAWMPLPDPYEVIE